MTIARCLCVLAAVIVMLPLPCAAQETDEPAEETTTSQETSPLTAAAWCVVKGHRDPTNASDDESSEATVFSGCDLGAGLSLYRHRSWAGVFVLGTQTAGIGIAYVAHRPKTGPVIAIAVGIVVPYDSRGLYAGEWAPAVGATLSFGRRSEVR